MSFNPNWHEGWYFYFLVIFGSDFVGWFLIETFQTFWSCENYYQSDYFDTLPTLLSSLEVRGGTKDGHFSFSWQLRFHSPKSNRVESFANSRKSFWIYWNSRSSYEWSFIETDWSRWSHLTPSLFQNWLLNPVRKILVTDYRHPMKA